MQKIRLIRPLAKAFTLIELMIVIAIIAILATIAIPSYNSYTQKAALSELLSASSSYKTDVEICVYNTGDINACNSGQNGIKKDSDLKNSKYLKSVSVTNGEIKVVGQGSLENYSYTLKPNKNGQTITWETQCSGDDTSLFPANFCS
ncbi:prepilin-type N-terminal cleavage/methylation domain-containing protein [Actinobacillus genomosp. 2]|uniref:prepilin-type N-terminal cleavage/methylation domain-containing protein n=1 Tax=Actinobacillus genomosp. 2 TaxID=230709 RepID=UPI00244172C0|nr:prepilin-type N-terminal cleavage/methylation domain-containing protein [Actinobacillus genomosp. 2]WGE32459.1 prepilin-type N-terminal cleavage/methylation domain-containing protein [Actinobacillus genomosp. 2]